jgi:hypothetical protein
MLDSSECVASKNAKLRASKTRVEKEKYLVIADAFGCSHEYKKMCWAKWTCAVKFVE